MIYKKFQQGDVVMFQVDDETYKNYCQNNDKGKVHYGGQTKTRAILAFGEVTGHTHRVDMSRMTKEAGVTLQMGWNGTAGENVPEAFEVHREPVILEHEEHNTVKVPPGKYVVRIVREFDHITRRARNVAD